MPKRSYQILGNGHQLFKKPPFLPMQIEGFPSTIEYFYTSVYYYFKTIIFVVGLSYISRNLPQILLFGNICEKIEKKTATSGTFAHESLDGNRFATRHDVRQHLVLS